MWYAGEDVPRLWFKGEGDHRSCGLELVSNVEFEFLRIPLGASSVNRKVVQLLEKGKWGNSEEYVDRFGIRRPVRDMSTSSKALLVVENSMGKLVEMLPRNEVNINLVKLLKLIQTRVKGE